MMTYTAHGIGPKWLACPYCRKKHMMRVFPDTAATRLCVYCRACKREIIMDITPAPNGHTVTANLLPPL